MKTVFSAKAKENLETAEVLFRKNMYNASANRAYYAAFHAAVVALVEAGIPIDRISHEALQTKFVGELIWKRKVYPERFRSYLLDLSTIRDNADYKLILISKKVAERQLKKAIEFVGAILKEIENDQ